MIGRIMTIRLADIVLYVRRDRHDDLLITVRISGDQDLRLALNRGQAMVRMAFAPDGRTLQTDDHREDERDAEPYLQSRN
ncbi:hypothetical protein [Rhodopseudomonas boonkerdii]|uniref:hypothetical protein n=1 Tax=Rhodopseudomonas boonkerdii TaxID=475937 RepID=UPI001E46E7BC|nr:hypothetical protein [Rhodopseudomonas boonkerdii]